MEEVYPGPEWKERWSVIPKGNFRPPKKSVLPHGFYRLTPPSGDTDLPPEHSRLRNEALHTLNIIYKVSDTAERTFNLA